MSIVTTLCYLRKDDCYLMLFRNRKEADINEGKWIGVGGKVKEDESPDEGLLREVYEETGLTLTDYACRGLITFITDQGENELMILYEGLAWEGTLTEDCDEGTLAWVPLAEIETLSLWEGDRLFMPALIAGEQDIRMKLVYEGDRLVFHERYS